MYANGEGVLTDTKRAYMWYNIAAYNGSDIGAENKSKTAKKMTPHSNRYGTGHVQPLLS
jgi:TPR repeat protein